MQDDCITLTAELVSIRSVSGDEFDALMFISERFRSYGWNFETIPVSETRFNIFVSFGIPEVCFTTHIDVVPAQDRQFVPEVSDGRMYGRGTCDAKGILASMIAAVKRLEMEGQKNMSLLIVVGEETDGIGAKTAADKLRGGGIRYLVNGEPTECKLGRAHKGGIDFQVMFKGVSCHSGYPEHGVDANRMLIELADRIYRTDFGYDPVLGHATVNIGKISGGTASNVVSDHAKLHGKIRVVTDPESVISQVESIVGDKGELTVSSQTPKIMLATLPEFEQTSVAYTTDIPHFLPLEAEYLLYGPGSIIQAHTDNEWIEVNELQVAVEGYRKMYYDLLK
jgi:acetylornithine deacetylase